MPGRAASDGDHDGYGEFLAVAIARVGEVALGLPETREEDAWVGVRWRVRSHTFAHVAPADGSSPAIDLAAGVAPGTARPRAVIMTFRSGGDELDTLVAIGHPYFKPVWSPTVVGVHLTADTDWDEIAELVTESYCLLAPRKLVRLVDRPPAG